MKTRHGWVAALLVVACVRQSERAHLRAITPAVVVGDPGFAAVRTVPRANAWADEVFVDAMAEAHLAIFEYSPSGKAKLRITRGVKARAQSSLDWRVRGTMDGGKSPGFSGGAAGQTVCVSEGFAPTGAGGQGITTPITCTEHRPRPTYAPSYSKTQRTDVHPVLIVVADSPFRQSARADLVRRFVAAQGNTPLLTELGQALVADGRWTVIVHIPSPVR